MTLSTNFKTDSRSLCGQWKRGRESWTPQQQQQLIGHIGAVSKIKNQNKSHLYIFRYSKPSNYFGLISVLLATVALILLSCLVCQADYRDSDGQIITHEELRVAVEATTSIKTASNTKRATKGSSNENSIKGPRRIGGEKKFINAQGDKTRWNSNNERRRPPPSLGQVVNINQAKKDNNNNNIPFVIPKQEADGNSQIVLVNFGRVVNELPTNNESGYKNDTTRLVSAGNVRLIKKDGQILCGETNKDGKPSIEGTGIPESVQNRIVGGNKAEPGEFPYQVRLNIRSRRGSSLCGAVIIDKRHLLTAAHCVTTCSSYFTTSNVEASSVQATVGDLRITASDGEQSVAIDRVTPHEDYSACSYSHNNYDLAMLRTAKPMSWVLTEDGFGSVNRICLPHPGDDYTPGENVTVSGWGVMAEDEGRISNVLNAVDIKVISLEDCKSAYGQRVNKNHVCAGLKKGGKDSCQGDSGGPLVRNKNGQMELVGIVSFGYGCAQAGSPGVYTKVSSYISWIKKNL